MYVLCVQQFFVLLSAAHVLHDERLGHGQEAVVAARVEMCGVLAVAALEVYAAERFVLRVNATAARTVEHGYAIAAAHLNHGVDHLLAAAALEVVAAPRGEEEYPRVGPFVDHASAKLAQPLLERRHADAVDARRVVVAANHHDVVERVAHAFVAVVYADTPLLEVYC